MQGGPAPVVVPDPGLLAADCYGPVEAAPGLVGLCVTDFGILGHHADSVVAGQGGGPAFYAGIARALIAGGCRVRLFTNGAAEDRALRDLVAADLAEEIAAGRAEGPADPQRPAGLAAQVAECATVIAHRLHACIIAYSYRRPVVGLGWDSKLESFFAAVGQPEAFVGSASVTPEGIASLALAVAERGIDPQAHAVHTQAAWAGIDRLLACATAPAAR
ncbi:polysaccharide pyruvyl transferase family protein [Jannaschia sp. M317]|uniref:polysaccharide pyruvyl transferase family protein n=1 Tax=Jannaschia sp. M317 TaxID=2867011 RepID=UPI0021A832B2|nr:polysaccharide pyruvyl transferase family protein [Jannaschia sp. M317]UWQ19938.1 polysaccharide pyruvyl transferase family protein [Jannaschia sp. M317]